MNKRDARIIALDVVIALIRREVNSPSDLTGEQLDDNYGWEFESEDCEMIRDAMDEIAMMLHRKHERSLDCLPAPERGTHP